MNASARESGQALLLVLLSIGVILTVALSVVSRSITDVSTTTKDEESLRAFSAAEAGVEQVLRTQIAALPQATTQPTTSIGNSQTNFTARLDSYPENPREFLYPTELASGDTATVWLAEHDSSNTLTCSGSATCFTGSSMNLCWGKPGSGGPNAQPAIVVSVLYQDPSAGNQLKYAYTAYDPSGSRRGSNSFSGSGITSNTANGICTVAGTRLANQVTLNFASLGIANNVISGRHLRAMTVMLLYNSATTVFGVNGLSSNLPVQGRKIESTGTSGESTRKVQVYALYPEVPTMFQAAIYSPPGITK